MSKKIIIRGLGFSVVHLVITLVALVATISGSDALDRDEPTSSTGMETVTNTLAAILMQPLESIWTPWMSSHMPGFVEWLLFFGNSLLWGFAAAFVAGTWGFRRGNLRHRVSPPACLV